MLALGGVVLAVVLRPGRLAHVPVFLKDRRAMGVTLLAEGLFAPAAVLTLLIALSLGPVSLVSVVSASRPLLVLFITMGLSTPVWNVLNEPLDRHTIGLKALSTALIVGGLIALAV